MSGETIPYISIDEYLEGEKESEERHEYFDGGVFAMAGASADHELVAGNFFAALHNHLRGKRCRVDKGDLMLRVPMTMGLFYYPDIMVTCEPTDDHRLYRERPVLLVEVLSENENKDLVEKYLAYQRIPTLEEYVVVRQEPTRPEVTIFRRRSNWEPGETFRGAEASFTLESAGLTLAVGDLYAS